MSVRILAALAVTATAGEFDANSEKFARFFPCSMAPIFTP